MPYNALCDGHNMAEQPFSFINNHLSKELLLLRIRKEQKTLIKQILISLAEDVSGKQLFSSFISESQ